MGSIWAASHPHDPVLVGGKDVFRNRQRSNLIRDLRDSESLLFRYVDVIWAERVQKSGEYIFGSQHFLPLFASDFLVFFARASRDAAQGENLFVL